MGGYPLHDTEPMDRGSAAGEPQSPNPEPLAAWRFRLAMLRHERLVYRVALSLLRNRADAEDVTQETFMQYWQRGDGVTGPREWLLRVARNASLDRLRTAARRGDGNAAEVPALPDERDPAWHYRQHELGATLERLIGDLPEPQRSLVVLFDVHGVSGRACARILDLNPNQVKVYLHRARRRLRLELEPLR